MKCSKCGAEFEGKFCPECGNAANEFTQQQNVGTFNMNQSNVPNVGGKKKKKPIYRRPWFIILAVIVLLVIIVAIMPGKGKKNSEKIDWSKMELGDKLPTPPSLNGHIWTNTNEELKVDLEKVSDDEYEDYVDACVDMGYTVDSDKDSYSYEAYSSDGYKLRISHLSDGLDIELEAPMQFSTISWPNSTVGNLLPAPNSLQGKFSFEHDTSFFVYIGETSLNDYVEYVQKVMDAGFNVDYDKGDDFYYADNVDGYHVAIRYEGFNIMSIRIDAPSEDDDSSDNESDESSNETTNNSETESENDNSEESGSNSNGLRTDFKEAMDAYEEFFDEYIEFMKKYQENPTDAELILGYTEYLTKYTECVTAFEKWESEDLNDAELAYYLEVQARVSKKLVEASIDVQ